MSLLNPVPGFNFSVFLMDAKPFGGDAAAVATSLGGLALGAVKTLVFGAFSEASGLNAELETEEYREGGANTGPHKFLKWGKYPNLVLKRGVTFNTDLWDWYYQVLYGSKDLLRKNGLILLTDRGAGVSALFGGPTPLGLPAVDKLPVAAWYFRNGLPERLQGPTLNAKSNEIAVETLEIAHEGLYRIGPAMIPGAGDFVASIGL